MPPDPLKLCRHYGLPLTKILATPLTLNNTFSTVHYLNFYFSDPEYLQHFFPDSFFILRLMSLHCSTCAQKSRTNSIGMRHQVWKVQRRLILQQNSPRKVTWRGSQDRLIRDYEVALVQTGEWNSQTNFESHLIRFPSRDFWHEHSVKMSSACYKILLDKLAQMNVSRSFWLWTRSFLEKKRRICGSTSQRDRPHHHYN